MVESKTIDICQELGQNFIDYSYEANSARAFADARDGLKPGQRACLWEMYSRGYLSNKAHVKSAKIAGAVTGNWWPHGDMAIYETFARMSQPWINNVPEVDWHGNNGSQLTGPECASSRYTEARLSKVAEEGLFGGINKQNVNMIPNFSEDDEWPEVLPAVLPRLMVNGCQGIGSTIANVWLPHNLKEVSKVIMHYLDTGEVDYKKLFPDFPSGGTIINKDEIASIYETGKGRVVVRGKADIDDNIISITELPYQVYVQPYIEKITEMAIAGELTGIESISNRSGKNKLLIEIECENSPLQVLRQLYSKTDLQKSYSANQWALVGKTPQLLTLKDYCAIYKNHNLECLKRELNFDLTKAQAREHIVEGLIKALEDIDNIIQLIKKSENSTAAKIALMDKYDFSAEQAIAILGMKLSSLARLEAVQLNQERNELLSKIQNLKSILFSELKQIGIIEERLSSIVKKYGTKRLSEVIQIHEGSKEDREIADIEPEKCVVVMTESGYIKRVPVASFKIQKRNGKGVKTQDDITSAIIRTNTIDSLMIFTNKGKMYRLLVNDIPEGTNTAKGKYVKALVDMDKDEEATVIYSLYRDTEAKYVLFVTKNGFMKKTPIEEYNKTKRKTGLIAINIKNNDKLATVSLVNDEDLLVITKKGMALRMHQNEVGATGRASIGVKGVSLKEDDEVLTCLPIRNIKDDLALFSVNGLSKKTPLSEFVCQKRGGRGVSCYPAKNDSCLAAATLVSDEDAILVCGQDSSICISAEDLSSLSKMALGTMVLKNGLVVSVSKV